MIYFIMSFIFINFFMYIKKFFFFLCQYCVKVETLLSGGAGDS